LLLLSVTHLSLQTFDNSFVITQWTWTYTVNMYVCISVVTTNMKYSMKDITWPLHFSIFFFSFLLLLTIYRCHHVTLNTKHVEVLVLRHFSWASVTSGTALVLCFFTLHCSLLKEQCLYVHMYKCIYFKHAYKRNNFYWCIIFVIFAQDCESHSLS